MDYDPENSKFKKASMCGIAGFLEKVEIYQSINTLKSV